jgi:hypothetical protein
MTVPEVIRRIRPAVANGDVHLRLRVLWAAAKFARGLATAETITDHFMALAIDAGLIDRRGRWACAGIADHRQSYAREDLSHIVAWGLRGMNPFPEGPLHDG